MKIIDLSHKITSSMPVFPGTEKPTIKNISSIDLNGYRERKIIMTSHIGTHIDAPAHMIKDGNFLTDLPINYFFGKACLIKVMNIKNTHINLEDLKVYKDKIEKCDFILFHTGWSKYWGSEKYFKKFPALSIEAARWLCSFNFKGIGFDVVSADPLDNHDNTIHKILFSNNKIIIENLKDLESIPSTEFLFSCLPLKIESADGSPVRAIAIVA